MLSPLRRPSPLSSLSSARTYATESISPSTRSSYRRHDREHVPPAGDSRREHVPPPGDSRRPYLAAQRNQYLFVRLKDGSVVSTMPELLGAVRGLERELGRVKDFQLQRDPYDPTRFLRWFRIRLEDPHYWDTLSETGRTLKLTIPVLPPSAASRPGGIGIGDIQGLLDPQEKVEEDFDFGVPGVDVNVKEEGKEGKGEKEEGKEGKEEGTVRTVEVSINRSTRKDPEQPIFLISKDRRMRIGQSFIGWGGFYQPSSPSSTPSPSSPTSTSTPTPTPAPASVFEVDGVSVAPTQTRVDKEVPRMEGLKKRYANVAVEEVRKVDAEESEWEREREREGREGEGVLVGSEGQTEQDAVNEQRDFDAILQAFEEAPAELAKSTTSSSIPETEDIQPLAASFTPPSPSLSTTQTSTPLPTQPQTPTSTTSKRALRKEKLLELARQNAQQPLPEALKARELDSQVLTEEEKAKEMKEGKEKREGGKQAVRERLWRLMGGLLP